LDHEVDGYWWTNVGHEFKAANQRCKPSAGNPGSRIIAPAEYVLDSGSIGIMRKAPWPIYSQFCCQVGALHDRRTCHAGSLQRTNLAPGTGWP
jgi:hypothetical protein